MEIMPKEILKYSNNTSVVGCNGQLILPIMALEILLQRYFPGLPANFEQLTVALLQFVPHLPVVPAIQINGVHLRNQIPSLDQLTLSPIPAPKTNIVI